MNSAENYKQNSAYSKISLRRTLQKSAYHENHSEYYVQYSAENICLKLAHFSAEFEAKFLLARMYNV